MPTRSTTTAVRTLDGLQLGATFDAPDGPPTHAVLLVHGAGVTREEGGFFTRIAAGLADQAVASLRIDLPGHGESEGRQEDLSLSGVLNAIRSGIEHLKSLVDVPVVSLLAASFSGGVSSYYAAKRPSEVDRLVLINPLIDYKQRFVDEKSAWTNDHISDKAGRQLLEQGYVGHSPSFKLGRPILNEVFWLQPRTALAEITAPTLIVHGTEDTFIPVASSRSAVAQLVCEHRLIELEGAQHGIAVPDDPQYADPQTQTWQVAVISSIAEWVKAGA
ncbi:alpha/beta fold hydrolase [Actinokineospora sp. NBRC 105648]|uniref:alpha/beta hydrolase n=1 Tax=Actinokineospora sp. NBRC 105648 TaxID=3032206 RepID=UPI0024A12B0C|nr:alpha/beta fold hydrolase [Actinokineospora sp. NBRC 105648]GLZ37911.1 alpha/beta hydrolase [Actinokineospora sp. NBRC 105648]